jgi:ferredoxin-NADP reductase
MFDTAPLAASVLGFITTIHLAMAVLRTHRSPHGGVFNSVTPVSLLLAASPWLMPSPAGVAVGLVTHAAWFAACEWLLPAPIARRPAAPPPALPRAVRAPAPVVRPPAARPAATDPAAVAQKPSDWVQVPVTAVFDETPDIKTFRLVRPDNFEFKAGQFLTLRVRADGREHARCYSISSPPESRGHMEISVKRLGSVSGTLHATLRPGSLLSVRPPAGAFVYPSGDDRPIVLIAGGVGITPLMAMLRHGVDTQPSRPIALYYSVRTVRDIAFYDEIRLLHRRHGQFRTFIAVTDGGAGTAEIFPDRINEDLIVRTMPGIAHATCMLCGPQPMLEAMTGMLVSMGVPRQQIHFEVFQPAVAVSAALPPRAPVASSAAAAHDSLGVTFSRSGLATQVSPDQTMLEAAESCGAGIPSLCRSGVCGTCRTRVVDGQTDCRSTVLTAQDINDGYVLPCVTYVMSDCTVDA